MNARRKLSIAALVLISFSLSGLDTPFRSSIAMLSFRGNASVPRSAGRVTDINVIPGIPVSHVLPGVNQVNPLLTNSADTIVTKEDFRGTFELGEIIKTDERDNLVIYFNCLGRIAEKQCAEFYRTGKMDSTLLSLAGPVRDYYTNDTLAFEAVLENSLLNGPAVFYHKNGKIMAKGRYKDNSRTGVWTYFYDNGNPEKVINFVQGYPLIVACHQRDGDQRVVQGNGKYKNKFLLGTSCAPFEIKGRVVEGKLHGRWKIYTGFNHQKVATEYYDHGKFIKRKSAGETYTGQPMISIHGFCPNEYLLWTENTSGCEDGNFQVLKYRGQHLHALFYAELLDSLNAVVTDTLSDQWLIAGIQLTRENIVHTVRVKSSIHDEQMEARIYSMLKSMVYFSVDGQLGNQEEAHLLFTILIRDNSVLIPAELYYEQWMKSMQQAGDQDDAT